MGIPIVAARGARGYRPAVSNPSLGAALGGGFRAAAGQGWLVALGLLVAAIRRVLTWPAIALALLLVARGAAGALAALPFHPEASASSGLASLWAPRTVALVAGLWLSGAVLAAVLRAAYLAGALPALAAGGPGLARGTDRFAAGLAYGFPRVLGAAILGFLVDLAGSGFAAVTGLGALAVSAQAMGSGGSPGRAAAVALALTVALVVALGTSILADAAVARAALRGEGPAHALAFATARMLHRPAVFLLAGITFGAIGAAGAFAVQAVGGVALGFAAAAGPAVLLGPQLMLSALAALVAAAVDLWWLGTVATLACAGDEDAPRD